MVTRRWVLSLCLALAVSVPQVPVGAQSDSDGGQLKGKVIAALKSVAGGTCPEELMNAMLLDQCEQQLERMQAHMSSLGPIKEAHYRGIDYLPTGAEAEVYRVVFTRGTMTWMAAAGPNGKLSALWSPG